jgi:hypothetical protein
MTAVEWRADGRALRGRTAADGGARSGLRRRRRAGAAERGRAGAAERGHAGAVAAGALWQGAAWA